MAIIYHNSQLHGDLYFLVAVCQRPCLLVYATKAKRVRRYNSYVDGTFKIKSQDADRHCFVLQYIACQHFKR